MTAIWLLMAMPVAMASGQAPASGAKPPGQAARGQAIFFDESIAAHCGSCHALAGKGTAVGPDISRLARLSPRGIATAIRATLTEYVQTVKLKAGSEFPGMPAAKVTGMEQFYDLSSKPPVLRKFEQTEVASTRGNATWKHPPSSAGFSSEQLADVIAYIKWASYGDIKGVNAADVE
jgi:mono/diheme cytochrome c family protein